MSLHLEFEPHSFYKGFAIKFTEMGRAYHRWTAYIDNGNTYCVDELEAYTLKELKQLITDYHKRNAERDAYNRALIGE